MRHMLGGAWVQVKYLPPPPVLRSEVLTNAVYVTFCVAHPTDAKKVDVSAETTPRIRKSILSPDVRDIFPNVRHALGGA